MPGVSLDGLQLEFRSRLQRMIDAGHGAFWLNSGYRSYAKQVVLYAQAVLQHGKYASHYVAKPGSSNHNRGEAGDLGGDVEFAARLAPKYDLHRPMPWEPWHFERTDLKSNPGAYTKPPPEPSTPGEAMATGKYVGWCDVPDVTPGTILHPGANGLWPFYAVKSNGDIDNYSVPNGHGLRSLSQMGRKISAPVMGIAIVDDGSLHVKVLCEDGTSHTFKPGD